MTGIPTRYRGYAMRSRLEARWAYCFDRFGWTWTYEPLELGGWIPDFALTVREPDPSRPLLVEVKPITALDPTLTARLDAIDTDHELLILGLGPTHGVNCSVRLGWLRPAHGDWGEGDWGEAAAGVWCPRDRDRTLRPGESFQLGFCHAVHSFVDRITGRYDGGRHGAMTPCRCASWVTPDPFAVWAESQREFQWHRD